MSAYRFLDVPQADELRQITLLYRQAGWWGEAPDDPDRVRRMVAGSHCFAVAEHQGRIVGMGRAISDGASDAWIQDVTVAAGSRGRGVASALVRMICRRLRRDGLDWIALVAENNTAPLYLPLGFEPMADARPMRLRLP